MYASNETVKGNKMIRQTLTEDEKKAMVTACEVLPENVDRPNKLWATCNLCKGQTEMMVNINDYAAWEDDRGKPEGLLIQDAMPYLTADEREVLISGTCGNCFDKMFPEPNESEISVEESKC